MMVHAVEEVNQRRELGNLTLGYHIVESCGDVTTALKNTQSFMTGNWITNADSGQQPSPPVLAVIGGYYSEISIAVTRQLNLESIPQISYGSTSGLLSDKTRFPSFMRTVPEDDHQARAIVEFLKSHNWTWVGVVTTDGEYGRYAVERLRQHATANGICFAFTSILPDFLNDGRLKSSIMSTINTIIQNENVKVIVSFAKSNHMMYILNDLLKDSRGRGKVWVASDNWSQSNNVLDTTTWKLSDVGTVFGTTLKSGNSSKFERFLQNLDPNQHKNNSFLTNYLKSKKDSASGSSSSVDSRNTAIEELINATYPYAVFSIELAVKAITQALKDVCSNKTCNSSTLQPLEFRKALQNANFSMDGRNYSFDKYGDLSSGYDVLLWKQTSPSSLDMNNIIGYYSIEGQTLTLNSDEKQELYRLTDGMISKCSKSCAPGQRKHSAEGQPVCCYECYKCPKNYFSNTTDSEICHPCDTKTHYSGEGSSICLDKKIVFMAWKDAYHIALLFFAALGALLTVVVGIIYLACWNTPIVRSSVNHICILLLFSLLCTFVSVVLFGGKPKDQQCQARQVLFGLSFTLSVSCILVKSFKIILAFEFDPITQSVLKKLYKPYLIIPASMAGQVVICATWLAFEPPEPKWKTKDNYRLMYCDEKLKPAFIAMLVYIGVLALICFGVAFKGRKLPQSFNDAKFITFSMLIYFIAWIIFIPVYVSYEDVYLPAVEMIVILISVYGILFCQFFTKCYIILFKKDANTEVAFRQDIRNYSMGNDKKDLGQWFASSGAINGINNPVFPMESLSTPGSSDPITVTISINHTTKPLSTSQVSNPIPTVLQNNFDLKKKQLQRYLSLPSSKGSGTW
ncbi:G-protein coupled receptor family C group 6 member A-like isoform X2 [Cololabis saira]|nr:G-protein coupled receptor family C group 6 member A-like isoform X2 [Cololabis saira]